MRNATDWTTITEGATFPRGYYFSRYELARASAALSARGLTLQSLTTGARRVATNVDPFADFA